MNVETMNAIFDDMSATANAEINRFVGMVNNGALHIALRDGDAAYVATATLRIIAGLRGKDVADVKEHIMSEILRRNLHANASISPCGGVMAGAEMSVLTRLAYRLRISAV